MKTMLTATDRLVALHSGRVLAVGPPREVIDAPEVRRVHLGACGPVSATCVAPGRAREVYSRRRLYRGSSPSFCFIAWRD